MRLGVEAEAGEVRTGLSRLVKSLLHIAQRDGASEDEIQRALSEAAPSSLLLKASVQTTNVRPWRLSAHEEMSKRMDAYSATLFERMVKDIGKVLTS